MENTIELTPDIAAASSSVQMFFVEMVNAGQSPRMAEMLALRQAPKADTDRELLAGQGTLLDQIGSEKQTEYVVAEARRQGYNPGINDVYAPTHALSTGDPYAFVKSKGDLKRARQRVEDSYETRDDTRLAPDLCDEMVEKMAVSDPHLKTATAEERRAEAAKKYGRSDG